MYNACSVMWSYPIFLQGHYCFQYKRPMKKEFTAFTCTEANGFCWALIDYIHMTLSAHILVCSKIDGKQMWIVWHFD